MATLERLVTIALLHDCAGAEAMVDEVIFTPQRDAGRGAGSCGADSDFSFASPTHLYCASYLPGR